ncbi:hypothetical protein T492DRAFT_969140 [Pavlovales sp. CCMP2436]|nr:hypothetical protein T492DRAFT_969140 [Pavlovales sp. CCMP2436]
MAAVVREASARLGGLRLGLAGGALAASVLLGPQHATAASSCTDESNPSYTVRHCRNVGMDLEGRLPRCPANSNCMSTSSVASPEHFLPPWSALSSGSSDAFSDRDVRVAWNLLNEVISSTPGLTIVDRDDAALYLRAEGASSVPPTALDDLEFVLRRSDGTVTFHSESRDTLFVYPLQRPVGCNDCHSKRLEEIRKRLGWDDFSERLGYDLSGEGESGESGPRGSTGFTLGKFVPLL